MFLIINSLYYVKINITIYASYFKLLSATEFNKPKLFSFILEYHTILVRLSKCAITLT